MYLYLYIDNKTNRVYIMMEARLGALFKKESEYAILERFIITLLLYYLA